MKTFLFFAFFLSTLSTAFAELPENFRMVSPGIYRSAQPSGKDLATLQRDYNIKTVISLSNDEDDLKKERRRARELGLNFLARPLSGFFAPEDRDVDKILAELTDPAHHPVLVHCKLGEDRTGLIVGLYRVFFESWHPEKAYDEMIEGGFKPILFPLEWYFEERTGYDAVLPMVAERSAQ